MSRFSNVFSIGLERDVSRLGHCALGVRASPLSGSHVCVVADGATPPRTAVPRCLERHCDSAVFVCVACLGSPRVFARAVEIGADTTLSVCKVIPLRTRVYSMGGNGASEMRPAVVTRALHTHHLCRSAVLVAEAPRLVTLRIEVAVGGRRGCASSSSPAGRTLMPP